MLDASPLEGWGRRCAAPPAGLLPARAAQVLWGHWALLNESRSLSLPVPAAPSKRRPGRGCFGPREFSAADVSKRPRALNARALCSGSVVRALCRPGPEAGGAAGAAGAAGAVGAASVVRVVGGPWVWAESALVGAPADEDDTRPNARDWLREINARDGGAGAQEGGGGGGSVLALAAEGGADAHLLQCAPPPPRTG